jgi:hypothetical protein
VGDVSVVIPAEACAHDVNVTIREIHNPQSSSSANILAYDFGPSGLQFSEPVTITIPYAVADFGTKRPLPRWYGPQTGSFSSQGITNVEEVAISSTVRAIRFQTTHFTWYCLLEDTGGGGGGGGGGCLTLSASVPSDPIGCLLPYVVLAGIMVVWRRQDANRSKR